MGTISLILFVAAKVSHALFLIRAKKLSTQSQKMLLWRIHLPWNGTLWGAALAAIALLQFQTPDTSFSPLLKALGLLFVLGGLLLVFSAFRLLGFRQAMGLRFFFPEQALRVSGGLYRFLRNPMYDGLTLVLVGLGLAVGIRADFALAIASFLLLNIVLANIENYEFSWNPL